MQELSDMEVDGVAAGLVIGVLTLGPLAAACAQAAQQMIQEQQQTTTAAGS